MLNERPLSEQTLEDVLRFLGQGIGENLTLDYKREVLPGKPKDNAELCKDVSALANSAGGTIIYGVDEEKPERTPKLPPRGTPRRAGRQPIEEWAAQVLASGVQPPMDFEIGVYDLEDGAPEDGAAGDRSSEDGGNERCVMAVRVQASPFAPHMVTSGADNRYYGRFYRRGPYESRIAEEYEVREMLERARRLYEGVEAEVARRGYADTSSEAFGNNEYAHRLATRFSHGAEAYKDLAARRVSVLLLPVAPARAGGVPRQDRREWVSWLEPNERRYQPDPRGLFVPGEARQPILGGIACMSNFWESDGGRSLNKGLEKYLLVGFDGSVEFGFSASAAAQRDSWGMAFAFFGQAILARVWQTAAFADDVRRRLGISPFSSYLLLVNGKNAGGGLLTGFAPGWAHLDPANGFPTDASDAPRCLETNLQIRRELGAGDLEEIGRRGWDSPPEQIRELADELSSAFGLQDPVLLPRDARGEGL